MTAGIKDLTGDAIIEAGDTFDIRIPLVDLAAAPLDFTGFTVARMTLRTSVDAADPPVLTLANQTEALADLANTGIVIGTAANPTPNGTIRIVISSADTAAMSYAAGSALTANRSGVYDLEIGNGAAPENVWRLLKGTYSIDPESTR